MNKLMPARKIDGRWHADFRLNGKRYRKAAPENTKRAATQYEDELRLQTELNTRHCEAPRYRSYEDFLHDWLDLYAIANNRPAERQNKESIIRNHVVPCLGHLKPEQVDERSIERLKADSLAKGLSPKTAKNIQTVVRKSLESAHDWGCIPRVPKVSWVKVPAKEVEVVSQQARLRLLADSSEPLWNALIEMGLMTGMRIGEMLALQWGNLDLISPSISVSASMNILGERAPTKNGKVRVIPMGVALTERLLSLRPPKASSSDYVFGRDGGGAYRRQEAGRALTRICRRLGIQEHVHWHKLRHTFATNVTREGVSIRTLQEILGHASIIMTQRYSHVDFGAKKHAIQVLESTNRFSDLGQILGRNQENKNRHISVTV